MICTTKEKKMTKPQFTGGTVARNPAASANNPAGMIMPLIG
jgi:hypothetical protein